MLKTMQMRTVVLIGSLSLGAGWLLHDSSAPQPTGPATNDSTTARRGPRPLGADAKARTIAAPTERQTKFSEQLRLKMQDIPQSPTPGRNPFLYGVRSAPPATKAAPSVVAAVAAPPGAVYVAPVRPRFELSGIASRVQDGKSALTAIVMDNGALIFAVEGEKLGGGYVVSRISETAMVIADPAGAEQTFSLKQ